MEITIAVIEVIILSATLLFVLFQTRNKDGGRQKALDVTELRIISYMRTQQDWFTFNDLAREKEVKKELAAMILQRYWERNVVRVAISNERTASLKHVDRELLKVGPIKEENIDFYLFRLWDPDIRNLEYKPSKRGGGPSAA